MYLYISIHLAVYLAVYLSIYICIHAYIMCTCVGSASPVRPRPSGRRRPHHASSHLHKLGRRLERLGVARVVLDEPRRAEYAEGVDQGAEQRAAIVANCGRGTARLSFKK